MRADKVAAAAGTSPPESRNSGMDKGGFAPAHLPSIQTLGEAVAVVRATAAAMGLVASRTVVERIALWALDLSNAYREVQVNRLDFWLQQFIWSDGVRLDKRCVFGAAHMPGLFQRISTFVLAVAVQRIHIYDAQHPYSEARRQWTDWRTQQVPGAAVTDTAFASIYLDDGSGMSILGEGEPLHGAPDVRARPVASSVTVDPGGRVRLGVFGDKSRGQTHLAIVAATFEEAGWKVAIDKFQYGVTLDLLGLGITTAGDGALFVPEPKRLGMIDEITAQQHDAQEQLVVPRDAVEGLVGRLSHVGQVACEANAYLQPMYKLQNAKISIKKRGGTGRKKVLPRRIKVGGGTGPTVKAYQRSLAWCRAALEQGVAVPLCPRAHFPDFDEPGCAFLFTDAAREAGTGHGAFTVVQWQGEHSQVELLFVEQRWSQHTLAALQSDVLSMPAGEGFGAVVAADAMLTALQGVTHLVVFTDSAATEAAINSANSPSPQMNVLVQWLMERWPLVQFMAVWQKGERNDVADRISRAGLAAVVAEAEAAGLATRRLPVAEDAGRLLQVASATLRGVDDATDL
jgi:hypothetical protein